MKGLPTASTGHVRCSSNMSRPDGSAGRRAAGFTIITENSRFRPADQQNLGPRTRMSGTGFRDRLPGQLPGSRTQRRLSAAELLSTVLVVLAGRDQGGISRSRQHHRPLRRPRAQPLFGNAIAECSLVEGIRASCTASGIYAVQRLSARPLHLPVLRRSLSLARSDLRSSRPAVARRADDLDQCRHRLRHLQFAEGQPAAARERDVSPAPPGPADDLYAAGERARLSAQLSARELARLSLLGYRARPVLIGRATGAGADGGTRTRTPWREADFKSGHACFRSFPQGRALLLTH